MTDAMLRTRRDLAGGDGRESEVSEKSKGRKLTIRDSVFARLELQAI